MPSSLIARFSTLFSSGFGLGYLPKAPGTFGTLLGIPLYYLLQNSNHLLWLVVTVSLILFAVLVSHFTEKHLGTHDSSSIVIDEVVGYLVAILWIPFSWKSALIAFILFRFFDILKPPPIRQIDRGLGGAWGVVLDDVVAGVFANLVLRAILIGWSL